MDLLISSLYVVCVLFFFLKKTECFFFCFEAVCVCCFFFLFLSSRISAVFLCKTMLQRSQIVLYKFHLRLDSRAQASKSTFQWDFPFIIHEPKLCVAVFLPLPLLKLKLLLLLLLLLLLYSCAMNNG